MAEYEFSELSDNEAIKKEYRGYPGGLVRLKKGDWILKPATAELLPEYKSMEVRKSDVWIVTYPKVFCYPKVIGGLVLPFSLSVGQPGAKS